MLLARKIRRNSNPISQSMVQELIFPYGTTLSNELANEAQDIDIRTAAGIALKNAVTGGTNPTKEELANRWLVLDSNSRDKIKHDSLSTLASPSIRASAIAAQVIAAIAAVEIPAGQWMDCMSILLKFLVNTENSNLRLATLQTIGFICESISPEVLSAQSNEILIAVIYGARKEEPSPEVQQAAITALFNSLEFVKDNFEREGERNYIMQVVCEAMQNPNPSVQVGAFECLVRIMSMHYDKMAFYMEHALLGLTVLGMKHQEVQIALQAVKFWSTVCEEENRRGIEAAEAARSGKAPESESKSFAKMALPEIIPVLLGLLTKQEEGADEDEDEWNVSMAAGTCLSILSQTVADAIVPAVIPFIGANIKSQDWHQRNAAVVAFGSILDGPDPSVLSPLVTRALSILLEMTRDENPIVKDTVAWTLGRICDLLVPALKPDEHLHGLVSALVNSLDDKPRIVTNCCWALMNLSDQLGAYCENDESSSQTGGPLAPYYEGIVQALLRITEGGSNESNYRTPAYEALASYVANAGPQSITVVQNIALTIVSRMEQLLAMQNRWFVLDMDNRNNWNEMQCNFCSVLTSVIRKLETGIEPLANQIMTILLSLIQSTKSSTVLEDAFVVIGAMAATLENKFSPYIQAFLPFLYLALREHKNTQLCMTTIGALNNFRLSCKA